MKNRYVSWAEHNAMLATIVREITTRDTWRPNIIVGLNRGGLTPAVMLSHYLRASLVPLDVSLRDTFMGPESNCWLPEEAINGKNILIVDDINDSGATINWIKQDWESSMPNDEVTKLWGDRIRIATLFDNESSEAKIEVSYTAENINKANEDVWIWFPWENWWESK